MMGNSGKGFNLWDLMSSLIVNEEPSLGFGFHYPCDKLNPIGNIPVENWDTRGTDAHGDGLDTGKG